MPSREATIASACLDGTAGEAWFGALTNAIQQQEANDRRAEELR